MAIGIGGVAGWSRVALDRKLTDSFFWMGSKESTCNRLPRRETIPVRRFRNGNEVVCFSPEPDLACLHLSVCWPFLPRQQGWQKASPGTLLSPQPRSQRREEPNMRTMTSAKRVTRKFGRSTFPARRIRRCLRVTSTDAKLATAPRRRMLRAVAMSRRSSASRP